MFGCDTLVLIRVSVLGPPLSGFSGHVNCASNSVIYREKRRLPGHYEVSFQTSSITIIHENIRYDLGWITSMIKKLTGMIAIRCAKTCQMASGDSRIPTMIVRDRPSMWFNNNDNSYSCSAGKQFIIFIIKW